MDALPSSPTTPLTCWSSSRLPLDRRSALLARAGIQSRQFAPDDRGGRAGRCSSRRWGSAPLYPPALPLRRLRAGDRRPRGPRRIVGSLQPATTSRSGHATSPLADSTRDEELARVLMSAAQSAAARGALASAAELADLAVDRTPLAETNVAIRAMAASSYHFQAGECHQARVMLDEAIRHTPPGVARAEAYLRRSQYEGNDVPSMARFLELGFDDLPAGGRGRAPCQPPRRYDVRRRSRRRPVVRARTRRASQGDLGTIGRPGGGRASRRGPGVRDIPARSACRRIRGDGDRP